MLKHIIVFVIGVYVGQEYNFPKVKDNVEIMLKKLFPEKTDSK
jgi:hypothetical protein